MSRSIEQAFMLMSTFECVFVIKSESPWLVSLLVFFSQCIQMLFLKMDFWAICLQKNTEFILVYSPFLLILLVSKITAQSQQWTAYTLIFRVICVAVVSWMCVCVRCACMSPYFVSTYLNIWRRFSIFITKHWSNKTVDEHHAKRSVYISRINIHRARYFNRYFG